MAAIEQLGGARVGAAFIEVGLVHKFTFASFRPFPFVQIINRWIFEWIYPSKGWSPFAKIHIAQFEWRKLGGGKKLFFGIGKADGNE